MWNKGWETPLQAWPPGAAPPTYSLCHFREVASRGNDLPPDTGQGLSEEGSDLWTTGDVGTPTCRC